MASSLNRRRKASSGSKSSSGSARLSIRGCRGSFPIPSSSKGQPH